MPRFGKARRLNPPSPRLRGEGWGRGGFHMPRFGKRASIDPCALRPRSGEGGLRRAPPLRHSSGIFFAFCASHASNDWQRRVERARPRDVAHRVHRPFEVAVELEHVAELVRARETERAVRIRRHRVEANLASERTRHGRRHLGARQVLARHAHASCRRRSFPRLEDAVRHAPDVLGRDPGHLRVARAQREVQHAVGTRLRPGAEVDEVLPVERRVQERRGQAGVGEVAVGFPLGVEVGNLVLALQRRHPRVGQRHEAAGVLERRPDDVAHARGFRRVRHAARLRHLLLGREVRPEERDEVRAVRALERAREARLVVDVRGHDLRARLRERAGLLRIDVARDRARREATGGVREDRPHESASLRAGGADDGDDLPVCHGSFPW